jgi:hypothetical protein
MGLDAIAILAPGVSGRKLASEKFPAQRVFSGRDSLANVRE